MLSDVLSNSYFVMKVQFVALKSIRETVQSQTSDVGKKAVLVLAHSFLLP